MNYTFTGNWSISKLFDYEACPMRFRLKYIDRLPQLPLKPDNPLERGSRIHNAKELYVKGESNSQASEARQDAAFEKVVDHLRILYACGMATAEQDWFFDRDWNVTTRENVWLWVKLDWNVTDLSQHLVIPGDYKSGKSQYKAIEHVQQVQLYSVAAVLKYEWADRVIPELHYLDEGWVRGMEYTREEALKFLGRFDTRAQRIYDDRLFRPNPTSHTCRYCPYGPKNGTGACPVGV